MPFASEILFLVTITFNKRLCKRQEVRWAREERGKQGRVACCKLLLYFEACGIIVMHSIGRRGAHDHLRVVLKDGHPRGAVKS